MTDDAELVEQLKRVQSDVGFRNWTRHRMFLVVVLVAFDLLISVLSITAIVLIRQQDSERIADTNARRIAFCHSLDDIGTAAEAAANGAAEGTLKTFLDPSFQQGRAPDQSFIDSFVQKYRDNTTQQVHAATSAEIATVKARNGFTPDCTLTIQPGG